jgi:cholesterol oxidase
MRAVANGWGRTPSATRWACTSASLAAGRDPHFRPAGAAGCTHCGSHDRPARAKNTLVKNYLWLAERLGVQVHPLTTVTAVRPATSEAGYEVETVRTGAWLRKRRQVIHADQVIFAAGALGTQRLLHGMRADGALPALSPRLGELTRTNSEAILGASVPRPRARSERLDFTEGVAITSSFSVQTRSISPPTEPAVVFRGNVSILGFWSVGVSCTGHRSHL